MRKFCCWLGHRWKWSGRKRIYGDTPVPFYPLKCDVCGKEFETTAPEKYIREIKR